MADEVAESIETAARWIAQCSDLVVFTGAGISTDSGLPDFRGPDGVWTRRDRGLPPPKMAKPASEIRPNVAHHALVELQRLGLLRFLISQNVDNLHIESGIEPERLAELHGNKSLMRCLSCLRQVSHKDVGWDIRRWGNGYRTDPIQPGQPTCVGCGGRVISSIVNFGDPMPDRELNDAYEHAEHCDVFFVIGSSLVVSPANDIPRVALEAGARLILLNLGETPFDEQADLRIWAGIGDVLPPIVERVRVLEK